ncbi:hypothetical protein [Actinomadura livida]|uniref:DUF4190 domain-containing protein n=1 Tax=Actinomadura livida TaxID=79909 RepID=A0A7W7IJF4_9ACTN|nr:MULTISPECIES: hypothetical protein [Actinomadura]MBB4778110.1 hypothetical protein [Actinomadura catellatispora]GGU28869.1 hypothetical protein GCM10010208_61990 [Actinomadura livida]
MSEQPGPPVQPEDRPGGRPAGEPPAGQPRTQRGGWRALWLGGIALLTSFFFYPLGLVLGIAALVVGIRARRAARDASGSAPGAVPGIVLGAVGLAFSVLSVSLTVFLWSELSGYQNCLSTSNTATDEQACQDEFYPRIEDKLGLPSGSMEQYGDLL